MLSLPNRNSEVHMSQKTGILLREMNARDRQRFVRHSSRVEQRFTNLPARATVFLYPRAFAIAEISDQHVDC